MEEFSRLLERLTRHFEETEHPRSLPILMSLVPARMGVNVIHQYVREEMRRVDQEQRTEDSTPDLVIDEEPTERGRSSESLKRTERSPTETTGQAVDSGVTSPLRRRQRTVSPSVLESTPLAMRTTYKRPISPMPSQILREASITPIPSDKEEPSRTRPSSSAVAANTVVESAHTVPRTSKGSTPTGSESVLYRIPFLRASAATPTSEKPKGKPIVVSNVQISPPSEHSKTKAGKGKTTDPSKIKRSSKSKTPGKKSARARSTGLPEVSLPQRGRKDRVPEDPEERKERLGDRVTKIDKHGVQHKIVYKHKDRHHYVSYDHPDAEPCVKKRQVTRRTHLHYLREQQAAEDSKDQREDEDPDQIVAQAQEDTQPSEVNTSATSQTSEVKEPTPTALENPEVTSEEVSMDNTPPIAVKSEVLDEEERQVQQLTPSSRQKYAMAKREALCSRVTDKPLATVILDSDEEYEQAEDGTRIKKEQSEII